MWSARSTCMPSQPVSMTTMVVEASPVESCQASSMLDPVQVPLARVARVVGRDGDALGSVRQDPVRDGVHQRPARPRHGGEPQRHVEPVLGARAPHPVDVERRRHGPLHHQIERARIAGSVPAASLTSACSSTLPRSTPPLGAAAATCGDRLRRAARTKTRSRPGRRRLPPAPARAERRRRPKEGRARKAGAQSSASDRSTRSRERTQGPAARRRARPRLGRGLVRGLGRRGAGREVARAVSGSGTRSGRCRRPSAGRRRRVERWREGANGGS